MNDVLVCSTRRWYKLRRHKRQPLCTKLNKMESSTEPCARNLVITFECSSTTVPSAIDALRATPTDAPPPFFYHYTPTVMVVERPPRHQKSSGREPGK
ncbi:hypothetical protein PLICRDRAFT_696666 [Plicaturopsis crispa FD-325 SS-3]|nr:hypothetical protein PLICRDRAFT_696666 [Plicaturopsis crispa FD-325 SS-3]